MKKLVLIGVISVLLASCGQTTGGDRAEGAKDLSLNDAKVHVYYFHGKMRCVTCVTLQEVAQQAVIENFAGNNDVAFIEVDFSEKTNEALAEKYEIVFSSLVIACGDQYKDITDQSFALVMGNPEGLKALIAQETNSFLNN
ncbi:MAG: nitrophenyl compound nitroreductase subunit ArsF family protein [Bacteroidales bacterium]